MEEGDGEIRNISFVYGYVALLFYVAVFISVLYYDISYINITS